MLHLGNLLDEAEGTGIVDMEVLRIKKKYRTAYKGKVLSKGKKNSAKITANVSGG